jgi:hypothetical protein
MHGRVVRELGMERRAEHVALSHHHGLVVESHQDVDAGARSEDARRPDEYERGLAVIRDSFETVRLSSSCGAHHRDVEERKARLNGALHRLRR